MNVEKKKWKKTNICATITRVGSSDSELRGDDVIAELARKTQQPSPGSGAQQMISCRQAENKETYNGAAK